MKRVFLIVLDGFGVGAAPDAALFNDEGANTFRGVCQSKLLNIPNLMKMGLGNLSDFLPRENQPVASFGRLQEISQGKDTTTGHWEMMGVISEKPFPTYPAGFPSDLLGEFSKRCNRGWLLNKPSSGIDAIEKYGDEHAKTGKLIVYTSVDSVFQIAAHEEVVPLCELYNCCKIARELCVGENNIGRIIARPFIGESGNYKRTANRRDFSLDPPHETALDIISKEKTVIGVGKIFDIFNGKGITESFLTHSNTEGINKTIELSKRDFEGLCFVNLVDFDMLYGHRRDIDGYAKALNEFDKALPLIFENLTEEDCLIITGDHGCDPSFTKTTDHTREYVPFILYSKAFAPQSLGTLQSFSTIGETILEILDLKKTKEGLYGKLVKKG